MYHRAIVKIKGDNEYSYWYVVVLLSDRPVLYLNKSTLCREMLTSFLDSCPSVFPCQTLDTLSLLKSGTILVSVLCPPYIQAMFFFSFLGGENYWPEGSLVFWSAIPGH